MASNDRHSYIEFFPSDWRGAVAILTPNQEWVLLQICLYNWDKNEPVPEKKLPLILGRLDDWEKELEFLVETSETLYRTAGGKIASGRAMASAKKAYDLWHKKSKGGRASAKKRQQNQKPAEQSSKSEGANENENENENESLSKDKQGNGANGDLIFSVDADVWGEWIEYRNRIKKPMSERTENRIMKELEQYHSRGHDPTDILHRSIDNGWTGIFEPKGRGNGNGNHNNRNDGFGDAIDAARDRKND